tara:strand:- start:168 stop:431 length:264 start_codon:yes stop_codon:yes gene_type:complete
MDYIVIIIVMTGPLKIIRLMEILTKLMELILDMDTEQNLATTHFQITQVMTYTSIAVELDLIATNFSIIHIQALQLQALAKLTYIIT